MHHDIEKVKEMVKNIAIKTYVAKHLKKKNVRNICNL